MIDLLFQFFYILNIFEAPYYFYTFNSLNVKSSSISPTSAHILVLYQPNESDTIYFCANNQKFSFLLWGDSFFKFNFYEEEKSGMLKGLKHQSGFCRQNSAEPILLQLLKSGNKKTMKNLVQKRVAK